ncbi:MAG: electron transfer flavoprotein subunit alpha/FixB family protein [Acidimicrobiia bacterium]|nr:electron transfer flavoprotein subunit alpha/FixB family protein [Acidimicrobiia bacterium]
MSVLVLVEHDRGVIADASYEALTAATRLAEAAGEEVHALTIGSDADSLAPEVARFGAAVVHQAHHELLSDYGPEAWGETLAQAGLAAGASVIVACGTDRGNEVMAQAAARMNQPFVANCLEVTPGEGPWTVARVRWGGSLIEEASFDGFVKMVSFAHHAIEPEASEAAGATTRFEPELDAELARTVVVDRVVLSQGITLATAPVVVGGGRGVGSAEGFGVLEELAGELGGVVGCSRVVTNNGWRPHTDQVGQTGTRIAPQIYVACGISGAIQHWVGAMASKNILAINTDPEANMVSKADYAVIGDLHEVLPAITAEIRRRKG